MGMAVTLGGVSSALVGFSSGAPTEQGQLISSTTIDIVTMIYAPLSLVIMLYALVTYEWRVWFLRKKQVCKCQGSQAIYKVCCTSSFPSSARMDENFQ
jgi:hypothetical protein